MLHEPANLRWMMPLLLSCSVHTYDKRQFYHPPQACRPVQHASRPLNPCTVCIQGLVHGETCAHTHIRTCSRHTEYIHTTYTFTLAWIRPHVRLNLSPGQAGHG